MVRAVSAAVRPLAIILLNDPLPILAALLIILFGKSAAAFLIVRLFGHPTSTALMISASLAQIGEFSFILAGLGVGLELLPERGRDIILAGAILSIILNPLFFAMLDRWLGGRDAGGHRCSRRPPSRRCVRPFPRPL